MNGRELAFIKQKLMTWSPSYEIIKNGETFAKLVKEFSWFNKTFTLDVPGPNDYTIKGHFWKHEYQFLRSGETVAIVSKKNWAWSDSYGVEIMTGEDHVSILCAAIIIDQILHDDSGNSNFG